MSRIEATTNFRDSDGVDLGKKLITKDYLMSVYPEISQEIGKTPELWTWGLNTFGQLGINDLTLRSTPVTTFLGGTNWRQVSSGINHTAAIKTDGTLWIWGYGLYGRLGTNDTTNRLTPVTTFAGGTNWKQVSCGNDFTAAIKTDGTLWTWGQSGYIGVGGGGNRLTPVTTFAGGNNWRQVSCGRRHNAAIKTDGTLWTWGGNLGGYLGTNDTINRLTPVQTFAGGTNWKQVACKWRHTVAIKTDGTLWTWGGGYGGALGTNDLTQRRTPITTFAGGTNWKQCSASRHSAAIKTDGTLWTWGYANYGQLGILNTPPNRLTPVTTFTGGTNWKQVSCGFNHTGAIKTDGTLWVWGSNSSRQLGINSIINIYADPTTTFAGGTNWKQIDCGGYFTSTIESAEFI